MLQYYNIPFSIINFEQRQVGIFAGSMDHSSLVALIVTLGAKVTTALSQSRRIAQVVIVIFKIIVNDR